MGTDRALKEIAPNHTDQGLGLEVGSTVLTQSSESPFEKAEDQSKIRMNCLDRAQGLISSILAEMAREEEVSKIIAEQVRFRDEMIKQDARDPHFKSFHVVDLASFDMGFPAEERPKPGYRGTHSHGELDRSYWPSSDEEDVEGEDEDIPPLEPESEAIPPAHFMYSGITSAGMVLDSRNRLVRLPYRGRRALRDYVASSIRSAAE